MALTLGSQGEDVRRLQEMLRGEGYGIAADSILGPKTMAAWNDYLRSQNNNSSWQSALRRAQEMAEGAGISADKIDPNFVTALATGKVDNWTQGVVSAGQAQAQAQAPITRSARVSTNMPSVPSWSEAIRQAGQMLNPLYNEQSAKRLQEISYDLLRRGGYGQPDSPGIVTKGLAPLEASRNAAIAQMAQDIINQGRQSALEAWQAEQNAQLERDRLTQALYQASQQAAAKEAARAFEQQKFDWQKQYQQGQLDLERAKLNRPTTTTTSPKEQFINNAYSKLLNGQPLTSVEKSLIGISDTSTVQSMAISMAQKDPNWNLAANDAERNNIIQYYIRLLTGQVTTPNGNSSPTDWAIEGGYAK